MNGSSAQAAALWSKIMSQVPGITNGEYSEKPNNVIQKNGEYYTEGTEKNAGKPENIILKMVEGRVSKALQEVCLVDQIYFRDGSSKVAAFLKANNAKCVKFIRYATGEGIEKRVDNWAEEVANAVKDL